MYKDDQKHLLELANIIKQQCLNIKDHTDEVEEINGCADVIIEIANGPTGGIHKMIERTT